MKRLALALVLLTTVACATNPATGQRQLSLINEQQEVAMGQQASKEVAQQMGLYNDLDLERYVASVGRKIANASERPNLPWEFHIVDDPMVNAFALPGGYVYVTRGILAHLNDEAELASVLGHEIGHVTARHSVEQMSKQQLAGIGLGVAMILSPQVAQLGDLANVGLQLMFLKFSRDDERQADDLGLRYMVHGGWDPNQMPPVFDVIGAISKNEGGGKVPEWSSTHPDPENRAGRLRNEIAKLGVTGGAVNAAEYVRRLDGVMFGTNPREGYTIGNTFIHPDLGFRMEFPQGWKIQNTREAVYAISPQQDAMIGLSLAQGSDARSAAQRFFSQQGVQAGEEFRQNYFTFMTGQTQEGVSYRGVAGFVPHRGRVFQLLGYTTAGNWNRYSNLLASGITTFTQETNPRYLNVEPKKIEVVKLPRAMTLAEFARQYPSTVDLKTLGFINGVVRDGDVLPAGRLAKRVMGGNVPTQ